MLIALLIAAQAPLAPVVAPGAVSTLRVKPVAPNAVCAASTEGIVVQGGKTASSGIIVQGGKTADAGIVVQGGLQPSAESGIIVQGGKTAGIVVQGGLQPSASSESAATESCEEPSL